MADKRVLNLSLEERQKLWLKQDSELEAFCREPIEERKRPEVVEVPDAWKTALGHVSEQERRRSRKRPEKAKKPKRPPPSLSNEEAEDLKSYFCYFDGICGLKSSWSEEMDAINRLPPSKPELDINGLCEECGCRHAIGARHEAERISIKASHHSSGIPSYDDEIIGVILSRDMERANRVRDALVDMVDAGQQDSVRHLWRVFGPTSPFYPFSRFGELAQLVDHTVIANQLSKEFGLPHKEAVEKRLRMPGGDLVTERLRSAATKMLNLAVERYKDCRRKL